MAQPTPHANPSPNQGSDPEGYPFPSSTPYSVHRSLKPSMGGAIGRLHRRWRQAITEAVSPLGMTESRWTVLVHLAQLGEGCTQQELARALAIEMPSLTRTLNQLEQQEMLERRADIRDRRAHTLWFTPAGQRMVKRLEDRICGVRQAICHGLEESELNTFARVLQAMEANVCGHLASGQGGAS